MPENFADRLLNAIDAKRSAICVGIDPMIDLLPDDVAGSASARDANDTEAVIDAIFEFSTTVLKIVAPHVPCVKIQSAYFEKYLWEGVELYYTLVQEAARLGLLVIGDVKRGDIGATSQAYAAAHLSNPKLRDLDTLVAPDAITVNPMLGMDTLEPFVQAARDAGDKGLFVLVRTSNPGSAQLQDVPLADGRTWSQMLADCVNDLAGDPALMGARGYSSIGCVVGATQAHTMQSLRQRLPRSIFLLPGYGTQGATGEMTRAAFDDDGHGAIVAASRSILYAHRDAKYASLSWRQAVEQAVLDMKRDVAGI